MISTSKSGGRGRARRGLAKTGPVVVLERVSDDEWKAVKAEVGGDRITVSDAQVLRSGAGSSAERDRGAWTRLGNGAEACLVANSPKSVCRFLDLVQATPEQTRQMVALRLETELPYSVAESTWVCERPETADAAGGNVLVLATETAGIADAEDRLRAKGIRCGSVELNASGFAELALASGPSDETLAVVNLDQTRATLAITRGTSLRYVRHIAISAGSDDETGASTGWMARLANELEQSIYDYLLRTGNGRPARLLVAGERLAAEGLTETLAARLGIPVEAASCPEFVRISGSAPAANELIERFSACMGAVIAVHHRRRGEQTAAPVLRRRGRAFGQVDLRSKRFALIGANVLLLVLLVAALFGVRAARLGAAERIIDEGQSWVEYLEPLQDEVDILQFEAGRQRSFLDALQALAEVLPSEVKVEKLTIDAKGNVIISGKTKTVEIIGGKAVTAIEASNMLANPKLLDATKEKDEYGFRLTCELKKGPRGVRP